MIAGAAISFVAGAAFSVATQVLVDHKKINEVNWVDAVAAGTSTALGVIGVNSAIQIGATIVGSIASSRYEGLSWEKSVYNGAVDGVIDSISSGLLDKTGVAQDSYMACTKRFKKSVEKVRETKLSSPIPYYIKEGDLYTKQIDRITNVGVKMVPVSNATSAGVAAAGNGLVQAITKRKKISVRIGWSYKYKNGRKIISPMYATYYV